MLNETDRVCSAVQIQYLLYPTQENLSRLYSSLLDLTKDLLNIYTKKKNLTFRSMYKKQIIHDASTELIERYIKKEEFYVKSFSTYQTWSMKEVMGHGQRGSYRKERDYQAKTVEFNPLFSNNPIQPFEKEVLDDSKFFDEILKAPDGKKVIYILYKSRYYKRAILSIAEFKSKKWIYENAVQLHSIFKYTRPRIKKHERSTFIQSR